MDKNYVNYLNNYHNTNYTNEEFIKIWINQWNEHLNDVINYFSDKNEKLLIYNIDTDNFNKIINFLPEFNLKYYDIHEHNTKLMYNGEKYIYDSENNIFKLN